MEIHAGKSGTPKRVPTVRDKLVVACVDHADVFLSYSLTQATDTGNIRLVFAAVKATILQNALKDSGIL
jgi:hypothetical protein